MKIQGAKKVHYDSGPNMTPLVDVVMVILIFLMLTGSFGGLSTYLFSKMPISKEGKGSVDVSNIQKQKNIVVEIHHIRGADQAYVDSKPYFIPDPGDKDHPEWKLQEATDLEALLKQKQTEYMGAGVAKDDIQVLIAPDRQIPQRNVIKVYEAAVGADFTHIGFKLSP